MSGTPFKMKGHTLPGPNQRSSPAKQDELEQALKQDELEDRGKSNIMSNLKKAITPVSPPERKPGLWDKMMMNRSLGQKYPGDEGYVEVGSPEWKNNQKPTSSQTTVTAEPVSTSVVKPIVPVIVETKGNKGVENKELKHMAKMEKMEKVRKPSNHSLKRTSKKLTPKKKNIVESFVDFVKSKKK